MRLTARFIRDTNEPGETKTSGQQEGTPLGAMRLGDFTMGARVLPIATLAAAIGVGASFIAVALLRMIALLTNLSYFHRFSLHMVSPQGNHWGAVAVLIPMAGGLVVGLMARFGSERIRGHGIPEAIESILLKGSRIEPRVALLKPLSSAIAIGTGGPFGAEGPIIMTGGAVGSTIGQFFHLTNAERKTLLVAGAAAGMSATFGSPVSAVLLALELLLFEWKPRSFIPVALASAIAAIVRGPMLGYGPLFAVPVHQVMLGAGAVGACVVCGVVAGAFSILATLGVYAVEDAFGRLPIHWMWWPAIGGIVVGLGGLLCPSALGVGYDVISGLATGSNVGVALLVLLAVKWTIWSVSLGSGTSGGVLAPLLIMGAALGGIEAHWFPNQGLGFWSVVSMGAVLAGALRAPLAATVFVLEVTHDVSLMLPLMLTVACSYTISVLTLKRSILTEKLSRRGNHLTQELEPDVLETMLVCEAMTVWTPPCPVVRQQRDAYKCNEPSGASAHPDESLRAAINRMAATGESQLAVLERANCELVVGVVTLQDVVKARVRRLDEENHRERVLRIRFPRQPSLRAQS